MEHVFLKDNSYRIYHDTYHEYSTTPQPGMNETIAISIRFFHNPTIIDNIIKKN